MRIERQLGNQGRRHGAAVSSFSSMDRGQKLFLTLLRLENQLQQAREGNTEASEKSLNDALDQMKDVSAVSPRSG